MTSTQLVFFGEVHAKQVCGPPKTSRVNECNVLFPINEEEKVDVKRGVIKQKIYQRKQPLSTSKRDNYVLEWLR